MKFTYTDFSQIGSMHTRFGQENQDEVCLFESEQMAAILMADGATACPAGKQGAQITCAAAQEFLEQEGAELLRFSPKKQAYLLSRHICSRILAGGFRLSQAGSTLQMLTVQKDSGDAQLLMVGSGMAARYAHQKRIPWPGACQEILSLITAQNAEIAARHWRFCVQPGDCILLGTNGFWNAVQCAPDKSRISAFQNGQWSTLCRSLSQCAPEDDATFAAISFY